MEGTDGVVVDWYKCTDLAIAQRKHIRATVTFLTHLKAIASNHFLCTCRRFSARTRGGGGGNQSGSSSDELLSFDPSGVNDPLTHRVDSDVSDHGNISSGSANSARKMSTKTRKKKQRKNRVASKIATGSTKGKTKAKTTKASTTKTKTKAKTKTKTKAKTRAKQKQPSSASASASARASARRASTMSGATSRRSSASASRPQSGLSTTSSRFGVDGVHHLGAGGGGLAERCRIYLSKRTSVPVTETEQPYR